MKIKLSKSQWEEMGKKANWIKEAQGRMNRGLEETESTTGPAVKEPRGTFILKIDIENAVFRGDPSVEIARLLGVAKDRVEKGETSGNLLDFNGNTVGMFAIR
jgi:hypothetical protein